MPQNKQAKEAPYCKLSLETVIVHYKRGCLTAKGALLYWVHIRIKAGWELNFNAKEISEMFGMSRSSFWAALKQLREEGEIEYDDPKQLKLKRVSEYSSEFCTESRILDDRPEKWTAIQKNGQPSKKLNEQRLESIPTKASAPLSNSYQTFKKTLSEEVRERFENYVRREWKKDKGEEIRSFATVVRGAYLQEWWSKFIQSADYVEQVNWDGNWESHPKFDKCVDYIREEGVEIFLDWEASKLTLEERQHILERINALGLLEVAA